MEGMAASGGLFSMLGFGSAGGHLRFQARRNANADRGVLQAGDFVVVQVPGAA